MANIPGSIPLVGLVRLQPSAPDDNIAPSSNPDYISPPSDLNHITPQPIEATRSNNFTGQPINKPTLPHVGPLPMLCDGFMIVVQGCFLPHADKCEVDFTCDSNRMPLQTSNVALRITFSFDVYKSPIVRNSKLNGIWGFEEKDFLCTKPERGKLFELVMLVTEQDFKVSFNGIHAFSFRHRCPMTAVTGLKLDGDMTVEKIFFQGPGSCSMPSLSVDSMGSLGSGMPVLPPRVNNVSGNFPSSSSVLFSSSVDPGKTSFEPLPAYSQVMPALVRPPGKTSSEPLPAYSQVMPALIRPPSEPVIGFNIPQVSTGLYPTSNGNVHKRGSMFFHSGLNLNQPINIYGIADANANWLSVNFKPRDDETANSISVHVNFVNRTMVRSSCRDGKRGPEESVLPFFPFEQGRHFVICVLWEYDRFKMAVNGHHLFEYFQLPFTPAEIHWLFVEGDANIYNIV